MWFSHHVVHDRTGMYASHRLPTAHLPVQCGLQMVLEWPLTEKHFSTSAVDEYPHFIDEMGRWDETRL